MAQPLKARDLAEGKRKHDVLLAQAGNRDRKRVRVARKAGSPKPRAAPASSPAEAADAPAVTLVGLIRGNAAPEGASRPAASVLPSPDEEDEKEAQLPPPAEPPAWADAWRSVVAPVQGPTAPAPRYVPPSLKGLRHLPAGARHWGASAEVPLCSKRGVYPISEFSLDDTGSGTICGMCVRMAERDLGIRDAEDYVEGKAP